METATVNGVELEYEVTGSGEPVLLISPVLADGFLPLVSEPSLERLPADPLPQARLGGQHPHRGPGDRRATTRRTPPRCSITSASPAPTSPATPAEPPSPPSWPSTHPDRVATLVLLELSLFSVPSGEAFLEGAGPVFDAYGRGEHEEALAMFLSAVSGLDWAACQQLLDERIPGAAEQALKDVDTFFGVELPGLTQWTFGPEQAAAIECPVLSVLGSDTQPLWVEVAAFLRSSVPDVEERTIDGVGHLLHIQRPEPVARAIAAFLGRHAIAGR